MEKRPTCCSADVKMIWSAHPKRREAGHLPQSAAISHVREFLSAGWPETSVRQEAMCSKHRILRNRAARPASNSWSSGLPLMTQTLKLQPLEVLGAGLGSQCALDHSTEDQPVPIQSNAADAASESGVRRESRIYKVHGLDCAEEVVLLKRAVGPLVGGEDRLSFDVLNGRMFVAGENAPADELVTSPPRWEPVLSS
jgi:hypothetical protein